MAQTKHQIQAVLSESGSRPLRQFGQNFMIDQNLVRAVADAGMLDRGDCVIEIGPGTGTLTEELLDRAARVVAVEIDRTLAEALAERWQNRPEFTLIRGDALAGKHELNGELLAAMQTTRQQGLRIKLVANLPYNIASPLVIEMLIAGTDLLAFTVQKEVAQRIAAPPGGDDYGPLTVVARMLAKIEVLRTLPPQAFWPAPTIDSALVRLTRGDRLGANAKAFGAFVHALFSFRRKTLRRALLHAGYDAERILEQTGADGGRRAEEFDPEFFVRLFNAAQDVGSV